RLETKAAPRVGAAFAVLRDQPVARPDRTATWRQHVPPSGGAMRGWVAERTQGQDCGVPVSAECGDAALRRCTAHPECRLGRNSRPSLQPVIPDPATEMCAGMTDVRASNIPLLEAPD